MSSFPRKRESRKRVTHNAPVLSDTQIDPVPHFKNLQLTEMIPVSLREIEFRTAMYTSEGMVNVSCISRYAICFPLNAVTSKRNQMNGAESLVHTLVNEGVNVCFTNPGTSEMHFVAALDRIPGMRCVLGLFEGVVTGAATATIAFPANPPPRFCTWDQDWAMVSPTCITQRRRTRALSTSLATMPRTTSSTTHHSPPTSKAWRAPCHIGCARPERPYRYQPMRRRRSALRAKRRERSPH